MFSIIPYRTNRNMVSRGLFDEFSNDFFRPFFEGGQIPFFRRLPKRGFKNPDRIVYALVNLNVLEANFNAGDVVDVEALHAKKLLGKGEMIVTGVNDIVMEVFEVTGFCDILNIAK